MYPSLRRFGRFVLFCVIVVGTLFVSSVALAKDVTFLVRANDFQFMGSWQDEGDYLLSSTTRSNAIDAMTAIEVPQGGRYHVWARAKDYASYNPGTRCLRVTVDGTLLPEKAGNHGRQGWAWEKIGTVDLKAGEHMLGLRTMTSPFARCSHLLLTTGDQDPNRVTQGVLSRSRVSPKKIAMAGYGKLPEYPALRSDSSAATLATLKNDRVRITFRGWPDVTGAMQVARETAIKTDDTWLDLSTDPTDERIFLIQAKDTKVSFGQGQPQWSQNRTPMKVRVGDKTYEVQQNIKNPYTVGQMHLLVGREVRQIDAQTVEVDYATVDGLTARGRWHLPPESADVRFELTFKVPTEGYYSAGISAVTGVSRERTRFVQLPPLFQFQRLPKQPCMLTDVMTPHAMALAEVALKKDGPSVCLAVTAEPSSLPLRWPRTYDSVYGFGLLNAKGEVQPSAFTPVLGLEDSHCDAGQEKTVRFRVLTMPGDWTAGLETVSEQIMNVRDYRRPVHASLTQAVVNMIDLMRDADASGWNAELKGFYNIEMAETATQASPLSVVAASLLTRDEELYATRALPTIEFILSRPRYHWSRPHEEPVPLCVPNCFYGTAVWHGLHSLLGELNPWLREFGIRNGQAFHSRAYNTSPRWSSMLAAYRWDPNKKRLDEICKEADTFLETEIHGQHDEVVPFDRFYNIHFYPYWWDLVELYELTGEPRYLAAAQQGAFHTIAGLWSHPMVPEGEMTINPDGKHEGHSFVWWKDSKRYRLGDPRKPGDTPTKQVPAWWVARCGLGFEQPSTYFIYGKGCTRNISMSVWAPHLLRLYGQTGRDLYRTYARNTIIGRFSNYPGYYVCGYSDLMLNPRYPYEGPDVSGIYYHHIPAHLAFSLDFLVAQAEERAKGYIHFPWAMQQGYAWFSSRVYGMAGGEIFGQPAGRMLLDGRAITIDEKEVDWLASQSDDRVWLILMSQSDEPVRPTVTLDAARLGLVPNAPITVYTTDHPEGESKPAEALSKLDLPAKGLVAVSLPASESKTKTFPKLPPLREGHVVRHLGKPWGDLHAMRIRSPFGSDSIFVVLTNCPKNAGAVSVEFASQDGSPVKKVKSHQPYEFSVYPWPIDQPCTVRVELPAGTNGSGQPIEVTLPGTPVGSAK